MLEGTLPQGTFLGDSCKSIEGMSKKGCSYLDFDRQIRVSPEGRKGGS